MLCNFYFFQCINGLIKIMLTVDHFKRPFIDTVLTLIKEVDESFDQDFNEHQMLSTKIYSV